MLSLILSYGATVNQRCGQGWTALHEAVSRDNTDMCETLIGAGATVNPPNTYCTAPLTVAARWGQAGAARYLIDRGTGLLRVVLVIFLVQTVSRRNLCLQAQT